MRYQGVNVDFDVFPDSLKVPDSLIFTLRVEP